MNPEQFPINEKNNYRTIHPKTLKFEIGRSPSPQLYIEQNIFRARRVLAFTQSEQKFEHGIKLITKSKSPYKRKIVDTFFLHHMLEEHNASPLLLPRNPQLVNIKTVPKTPEIEKNKHTKVLALSKRNGHSANLSPYIFQSKPSENSLFNKQRLSLGIVTTQNSIIPENNNRALFKIKKFSTNDIPATNSILSQPLQKYESKILPENIKKTRPQTQENIIYSSPNESPKSIFLQKKPETASGLSARNIVSQENHIKIMHLFNEELIKKNIIQERAATVEPGRRIKRYQSMPSIRERPINPKDFMIKRKKKKANFGAHYLKLFLCGKSQH